MKPETPSSRIQVSTLPSGVQVVTEEVPGVRSVSVGAWVFTGSRDERPEEAGISHFIEHAVFKGTERRSTRQIARHLESVGGYLDAFTTKEHTCYSARALAEHLPRAVEAVTDLVLHPTFPAEEVEKEKDVIIEEIKMYEDTPEEAAFDLFDALLYDGHPLAHPILGTEETVRSFTPDGLRAFMDAHYTPDRTVLAAAGHVEHERVVALAEKAYAATDRAETAHTRQAPPHHSPQRRAEAQSVQQAHLILGGLSVSLDDPRRLAVALLHTILGEGMSSRLHQNIRERYGTCYTIYSFADFLTDGGAVGVYTAVDPDRVEQTETRIVRELEKLRARPVGRQTLGEAKAQLKGAMMFGLESTSHRMGRLARELYHYGRIFSLDEVEALVDAVTAEDVQQVAVDLLDPEKLSCIVLQPE